MARIDIKDQIAVIHTTFREATGQGSWRKTRRHRIVLLSDGRVQFGDWYRRVYPTDTVEQGWRLFKCREKGPEHEAAHRCGLHRVMLREEDWQRLLSEKALRAA